MSAKSHHTNNACKANNQPIASHAIYYKDRPNEIVCQVSEILNSVFQQPSYPTHATSILNQPFDCQYPHDMVTPLAAPTQP